MRPQILLRGKFDRASALESARCTCAADAKEECAAPRIVPEEPCFRRGIFSADGSLLLTIFEDQLVRIIDVGESTSALKMLPSIVRCAEPPIGISWCPFSSKLENACFVSACRNVPIQMWDASDASLRASFHSLGECGEILTPQTVLWMPDGWEVAAGFRRSELRTFDVTRPGAQYKSKWRCQVLQRAIISCIDFCTANSLFALGTFSSVALLHDPRTASTAAVLRGHRTGLTSIQFSPSGSSQQPQFLFSAERSDDSLILQWDLRNVSCPVAKFARDGMRHQPIGFAVSCSPLWGNGEALSIVSACSSGHLRVFDVLQPQVPPILLPTSLERVNGVDVSGSIVAVTAGAREHHLRDRYEEAATAPRVLSSPLDRGRKPPMEDEEQPPQCSSSSSSHDSCVALFDLKAQ